MSSIGEIHMKGLFTFILILIYIYSTKNYVNMKKLLLFVCLSLSTLIASSQIDTIIVSPSTPFPSPDSLGYNAELVITQPFEGSNASYYYCFDIPFPIFNMSSNFAPTALVIVYDNFQQLWYSSHFLFNIPSSDTLIYNFTFDYWCMSPYACGFEPSSDPDFDGIASDSIVNLGQISPVISNYYSIGCLSGINEVEGRNLKIFPNAATDVINISSPFSSGTLRLYSTTGNVVLSKAFFNTNFSLDVNSLVNGSYMVELINSNNLKLIGRFVKI